MRRKDFLIGLGGLVAGAPLGAIARSAFQREPAPARSAAPALRREGQVSYAQVGEDLIVNYIFGRLRIKEITYLDIGAYDPVRINNTYLFYQHGHRGVLVEPNVAMCEKLRAVRPKDTTLEAGIGIGKPGVADYYVMSDPSWSTFDKAEADHQVKATNGKVTLREVRRMPLLNVNDVMAEHFKGKAPSFVSIDAEGWHLAILKSIDYRRFRPKVICVETLVSGENRTIQEIPSFMRAKGYVARGGSFVNTIFVDSKLLA
jgi:hypothetical protein